jgi:hypothetical protein
MQRPFSGPGSASALQMTCSPKKSGVLSGLFSNKEAGDEEKPF